MRKLKSGRTSSYALVGTFKSWFYIFFIEANIDKPNEHESDEDQPLSVYKQIRSSHEKEDKVETTESERYDAYISQRDSRLIKQTDQQAKVAEKAKQKAEKKREAPEQPKQSSLTIVETKHTDTQKRLDMERKEIEVAKEKIENQRRQMEVQKEQNKKSLYLMQTELTKLEDEKRELLQALEGEKKKREMSEATHHNKLVCCFIFSFFLF